MPNYNQLEFIDISRDRTRPPGGGQVIEGYWVYLTVAQTVGRIEGPSLDGRQRRAPIQAPDAPRPHQRSQITQTK